MDEVDSDTFAVTLSLDDYADGDYIFLVRARDAAGNVSLGSSEAETNLTIARRADPEIDLSELELTGTTEVGDTLAAAGATATGSPEPELSYRWRVCPQQAGDCMIYYGPSFSPEELTIGWSVELLVQAGIAGGAWDEETLDRHRCPGRRGGWLRRPACRPGPDARSGS
jgi:hypothetical protein